MKYKRLTKRGADYVFDNCCNCEYGDNPQGGTEHCCHEVMKNRLAELEDKIEQGTLIEVIRCKDCRFLEEKHYEDEVEKPYVKLVCKLLKKQFQPNDFCSYAEKRLKELQE